MNKTHVVSSCYAEAKQNNDDVTKNQLSVIAIFFA